MTDWTGNDYLAELARRPGAAQPATIGQLWDAEWQRAGLDTIGGVGKPFQDAMGELTTGIEGASGQPLADYAFSQGINLAAAASPDERVAMLGRLVDSLPEDKRKSLEMFKDVRARAADKAQKIEADANDLSNAPHSLTGTAASWLAGVARSVVDPANLAAMGITLPLGGEGGAILPFLARQALAAGTAQAMVEPVIEPARGSLGLEAGPMRAAENIGSAALGGGLLAGLFRGAGAAIRLVRGGRGVEAAPLERPQGQPAPSEYFHGYLTPEDAAALDQGHAVADNQGLGTGAAGAPGYGGSFDIAGGAQAQPLRGRLPEQPIPPSDVNLSPFHADELAALDRGHPVRDVQPLGANAPDVAAGPLDIAAGSRARVIRERQPIAPPTRSDLALSALHPEDAAVLDRGSAITDNAGALGGSDLESHWQPFHLVTAEDMDAAARSVEANHIIDATAPEQTAQGRQAHAERVDAAARAMEEGRPLEAVGAQAPAAAEAVTTTHVSPPRRVRFNRPLSFFEYLANGRGLAPHPDLAHILDGNPFVPGFGRLIRKGGMSLDEALEAAKEGRYMFDAGDVTGGEAELTQGQLLDAIREEAHGNRLYPQGEEGTRTGVERAAERERSQVERERFREEAAANFDARLAELKIDKVPKGLRARALQIMEKEGERDPLLAYERALLEHEDKQEAIRRARKNTPELTVPGWDTEELANDAGPAPGHGETPAREIPPGSTDAGPGAGPRPDRGGPREPEQPKPKLGDPGLAADADRALAEHGGDFDVVLENADGSTRRVGARQLLREAEEDAKAANELRDCAGGGQSEEPPF